jgi:hypothetical protein
MRVTGGHADRPDNPGHVLPPARCPGLSENIRVRSLVGRYLEHSRIFYFSEGARAAGPGTVLAAGGRPARQLRTTRWDVPMARDGARSVGLGSPEGGCYLLGSADMMERNLDRRVEALVDVKSRSKSRVRLREILEVVLADDELAWELSADSTWHKVLVTRHFNAQRHFQELASVAHRGEGVKPERLGRDQSELSDRPRRTCPTPKAPSGEALGRQPRVPRRRRPGRKGDEPQVALSGGACRPGRNCACAPTSV